MSAVRTISLSQKSLISYHLEIKRDPEIFHACLTTAPDYSSTDPSPPYHTSHNAMHDRPAPLPPFRSHLRDGPLLGCLDPGTHFHRFSTVLHANNGLERAHAHEPDRRTGRAAGGFDSYAFFSPLGRFFFQGEKKRKRLTLLLLLLWGLRLVIWIWCMCDGWFRVEW